MFNLFLENRKRFKHFRHPLYPNKFMEEFVELFDMIKHLNPQESDGKITQFLGIHREIIYKWRQKTEPTGY